MPETSTARIGPHAGPAQAEPQPELQAELRAEHAEVRVRAHLPILNPRGTIARDAEDKPSGDASAAVRLAGVTHRYPSGVRALDGVDLAIPARAHTVLVGASGSGKTTLLGCLSGRVVPTEGTIERRGTVATIYQDLRLVPQRSVLGNVLDGALGRVGLCRSLLGMPSAERREAVRIIERVGLSARAGLRVSALSGGERQRVAIARALMQRPGILLADEPISALDSANAHAIMALLRDACRERGITLVTVLHDEALVAAYGDHRVCLHAGAIVRCGAAGAANHRPCADHPASHPASRAVASRAASSRAADAPASRPQPTPCAAADPRTASSPIDPLHPQRPAWMRPGVMLGVALAAMLVYGWSVASLGLHETGGRSVARGLGGFLRALVPTSFEQLAAIPWSTLLASLVETLQMSLIGTTAGLLVAYPLSVLAARNTAPRWMGGPVRQLLNAIRTVPAIIWALLFVAAVGFGQLAGVLALTLYSVGYLTKFFYESFENAPTGAQRALAEIGASGPQRFVRAVGPASAPAAVAAALFMLEYNVRSASVLGLVDAGGIGYYIKFYLDMRQFPAAMACLLLIFAVVVVLDAVSTRVRRRLLAE